MNTALYLNHIRKKINSALKRNLNGSKKDKLSSAVRYAVFSGGKRLRPLLFLVTFESLGGKISAQALKIASAIEFIHIFSLIQDDLPSMDNDEYRRGRLTVHKVFGEATAILASDILLSKAYEIIADDKLLSPSLKIKILSQLIKATQSLISGQQRDLGLVKKRNVSIGELNKVYREKTGALISACLKIAGILREVSIKQSIHLARFGDKLGLAYQIGDDVLNITGGKRKFKGRSFSDAQREKETYPAVRGLKKSKLIARRLVEEAKEELENINIVKEKLFFLCDFILRRTY